jgi:c-di-GMP-binding flagellar brake protein YcgR
MSLQSLVFCGDEKIVRVLRRVLSDLEISLEHCPDPDAVIRKLTRKRFEAVIVDCADAEHAAQILKSVRSAPCNRHAVAVALVEEQTGLRSVFDLGAHFVLYKPISSERAKSSFRAARALMKRERRRHERILVQVPVTVIFEKSKTPLRIKTADLGEGGMAVQLNQGLGHSGPFQVQFTIPGSDYKVDCAAEVAWENGMQQAGFRFKDLALEPHKHLLAWIASHSADLDKDDPPIQCKLTDLSLGGCYLETATPFPQRTRVTLSMRVGMLQVEAEGVVRVLHPDMGMGVEFTQGTTEQRQQVEKFIHALMNSNGVLPDLMVEPQGIEPGEPQAVATQQEGDDPLVFLFQHKAELTAEAFHAELRRQRGGPPEVVASA